MKRLDRAREFLRAQGTPIVETPQYERPCLACGRGNLEPLVLFHPRCSKAWADAKKTKP